LKLLQAKELEMVPDLFAVCLLVLGLGLVLGYLLAMPRVKVLEKELAPKKEKTTGQELPQHQNSYWRFEGPKLQKRVQDLEMELEYLRSKTLWRQD
jgi:uncharacterized protein YhdP